MNKAETKKCIEVMQAWVDGENVIHERSGYTITDPTWNWNGFTDTYEVAKFEPKRGQTVLVRQNDKCPWIERVFIVHHGSFYWCENLHGELCSWNQCEEVDTDE